jgi:hypothetical protein
MTAPASLRKMFDHIGLIEVESTDDSLVMEMPVNAAIRRPD